MTTVTIEVDDELLARARDLATAANTTVSEMFQRLLRVAVLPPLRGQDLPPLTRQAMGMLPAMSDQQVEDTLDQHRSRKYGAR
jgi:hypothetical protein